MKQSITLGLDVPDLVKAVVKGADAALPLGALTMSVSFSSSNLEVFVILRHYSLSLMLLRNGKGLQMKLARRHWHNPFSSFLC